MTFHEAVVVVTGGSAGVGRATALAFAGRGARVAILARGSEGLKVTKTEIEGCGALALTLLVDVADASAVEDAASAIESEFGPIDVWVNNAMVSVFKPFAQMSADEFERVTHVTYLGYVHGTMAALRRMRSRDRGTIVQVGSALHEGSGVKVNSVRSDSVKPAMACFRSAVRALQWDAAIREVPRSRADRWAAPVAGGRGRFVRTQWNCGVFIAAPSSGRRSERRDASALEQRHP